MSNSGFSVDDLFESDYEVAGQQVTESVAVDDAPIMEPDWNGPRCEKCAAPVRGGQVDICRHCGWYASLGTFVELDQSWEPEATDGQTAADKPAPSHLQVWMNLLPWYLWLLIAGVVGVVVQSVAVRLVLAESALRTWWSLTQLAVGTGVFGLCHVILFLYLSSDNSETALFDIVVSPLKAWLHAARQLPRRLWIFDSGVMGLAAAAAAMAIIGGIPYERLLDWGFKERPKSNLMGAVMEQAKKAEAKDMSLEEAIEELSGKAGVDDLENKASKKPEPKVRHKIDCVILGFRASEDGLVNTLILGAAHRGRLRYAGRVTPNLDGKKNRQLFEMLTNAKTNDSFLPLQITATWVRPVYTCRVSYAKRFKDGRLMEIEWAKMLGEIKLRKKR